MTRNSPVVFRCEEFGEIRTLNIGGEPWFIGREIAEILGYENGSRDINRHVDPNDKKVLKSQNYQNGTFEIPNRGLIVINESGLYSLILSSKLPSAKKFSRWVTSEILPSLRKNGAYMTAETLYKTMSDPRELAKLLTTLADERDKCEKLEKENAELSVKANYCDIILMSKNSVPITQIAKDYGMSAVAFNKLLYELKIQFPVGKSWVLYSKYANKNYTQSQTYTISESRSVIHTCWTQKGRLFLYDFLKERGILPMSEAGDNYGLFV